MFLTKGTKVETICDIGDIKKGTVFVIENLLLNGTLILNPLADNEICAVLNKADGAAMCISFDQYNKYFKEHEEPVQTKREWNEWKYDWFYYFTLGGQEYSVPVKYRDNGKILQLRTNYTSKDVTNLRVRAVCNTKHGDNFNEELGLNIADARLTIKLLEKELEKMLDDLK